MVSFKGLSNINIPKLKIDMPSFKKLDISAPKTKIDISAPKTKVDISAPKTKIDADISAPKPKADVDADANIKTKDKTLSKSETDKIKKADGSADSWINRNKNLAGLAIGATTIGAIMIAAQIKADKINNTLYTITSISIDPQNSSKTILKFSPEDDLGSSQATVTIESSNSSPSIDGSYTPIKINSPGSITISKRITTNGTSGQMRCKVTMGQIASGMMSDIASTAGQIAGAAAGAAGAAGGSFFRELFGDINFTMYIIVSCIVLLILSSLSSSILYAYYNIRL
jgi:hypothetical protein